jgi:hypothetical protein
VDLRNLRGKHGSLVFWQESFHYVTLKRLTRRGQLFSVVK